MNVIYLGCNGFPFGFAEVQKQKMISKALITAGASVTIINTKGILREKKLGDLKFKGNIENIKYFYCSLSAFRPTNILIRNFLKIMGRVIEFFMIPICKKKHKVNIAIISTRNIYALIYYFYILRLFGYKMLLSYEEFVKTLNLDSTYNKRNLEFDDLANQYCDGILPISSFLENYQRKINPDIKQFIIPALTDFNLIDSIKTDVVKRNTILFCGSSEYSENIKFIIDAFEKVKNSLIELELVIHGAESKNQLILDYIKQNSTKKNKIHILTKLSFEDLIRAYKTASLLLIPLKPSERDIARFPHKISEYTASRTPILTTDVGEISKYFINNINAFIVEKYNYEEYAHKIDFAFKNKTLAQTVSEDAYKLGRKEFHYDSIAVNLFNFCKTL